MTGSQRLIDIVFYVSLCVVIGLAITFTILFSLYAIYKKKNIRNGHEDKRLLDELKKKYQKQLSDEEITSSYQIVNSEDDKKTISSLNNGLTCVYDQNILNELKKRKLVNLIVKAEENNQNRKRIGKAFSIFLYAIIFIFLGFIAYYKFNNESFYIGNTSYIVIQTGSMETVNKSNDYISKNNLDNDRIYQYSMIGIDKVKTEDIKKYDIIAFKNSKNETIVHRVINIEIKDGVYYFNFRGDANNGSTSDELNVTSDKIIGKYNGFQNFGLGVATTYFKSSAGIVALSSAVVFLISFDYAEDSIEKEYKKRYFVVALKYGESED